MTTRVVIGRRQILRSFAGLSAAGTLGAWRNVAAALSGPAPDLAFGFARDRVPMNAANLCPMPSAVSAAVAQYARDLDLDLSDGNRRRIEAMKENARQVFAAQLGVSADELAIVRNTSEANGIVVQGLRLAAADEVLLWDQNHPSNALAWEVRAAREGFSVRYFALPPAAGSIDEVVSAVVASLRPSTRLVSFTHISNVTGFRLPAAEICASLRRRRENLFIHIDGAQTWGVRDVDLSSMGCDSFSASAHKWLMGPRETGLLYVREGRLDDVAATLVSIPWGNEVKPSVVGARRFEAMGQRDDAAIAALSETAAWHAALTPAVVEQRATAIADRLRAALTELGVSFVSSLHPDFRSNVIVLAASEEARRELPERVLEQSGVITAAVGGLRMSPHIYNTPEHVDRVAGAIGKLRRLLG